MKIYDMHIHCKKTAPEPEKLLSEMAKAGIYGGCVFSAPPAEQDIDAEYLGGGATFEERLQELKDWCGGSDGRLLPVMWVHPYEDNILENVEKAVAEGVLAFKLICGNYYVSDEKCMALLRKIASFNVPVIFHTGILWDGNVSSRYNRPINWEALIEIEGIRFSMGHCSWPWIDECIALYGKFLNAKTQGRNVEMFFDITPGTPDIYREELFTKLYTIGYNVGDNVLFGLDSFAPSYSSDWAKKWLKTDGALLDSLGVSAANREKLYCGNIMRFLGLSGEKVETAAPVTDNANAWSPVELRVNEIIRYWYDRLGFPWQYNADFERLISEIKVSDAITLESYDKSCPDGERNLLSYLYLCEEAANKMRGRGIPEEIITDTLADIVNWTKNWSNVKGHLCLFELGWLERHLSGKLFKIGRLQYCMAGAEHDIESCGIKKGDPVMEIHIPQGESLTPEGCADSINSAKGFFDKYFPEYSYSYFTCHSWLLDDDLKELLPENSGIIRFGNMFDKISADDSNALLRYLFSWDTNEHNVKYRYPASSLASKVQKAVTHGRVFHETLGVIKK